MLLVITPQGNVVPVYYMTGVKLPAHLGMGLLGLLTVSHTVVPAQGGGTQVKVNVTVPDGLLGPRHDARLKVSSEVRWGGGGGGRRGRASSTARTRASPGRR